MRIPEVVIVSAARTPIGRLGGALKDHSAVELGALVLRAAVERSGIAPEELDEVIVGHARQAGNGPNPGRLMALGAGLPVSVPAYTVQQACVSSMKALILAYQTVVLGNAEVVAVAGCEHMSSIPYFLFDVRWGRRMGDTVLVDGMYRDGFIDPLTGKHMGALAEAWAERYGISREEQDQYALRSQQLTAQAAESGFTARWIVSVPNKGKGQGSVEVDEHPRPNTTLEELARLKPVFKPDGTITAGNASGITDGAVAAVVMSDRAALQRGLKPLAVIRATDVYALQPEDYGLAPVHSIKRALRKAGLTVAQMDQIEINEAFAVQVLACCRELETDMERVNPLGGAIALGHPIGMSGLRVALYAVMGLQYRGGQYAVASLCGNGGHAGTVVLERI